MEKDLHKSSLVDALDGCNADVSGLFFIMKNDDDYVPISSIGHVLLVDADRKLADIAEIIETIIGKVEIWQVRNAYEPVGLRLTFGGVLKEILKDKGVILEAIDVQAIDHRPFEKPRLEYMIKEAPDSCEECQGPTEAASAAQGA